MTEDQPSPAPEQDPYSTSIANLESNGDVWATNPNYPVDKGGPLGPHQFLASTWRGFVKANPDLFQGMTDDEAMRSRTVPSLSAKATDWLAKQNATVLQAHGFDATPQNLALAHAFGGAGASGILKFDDKTSLAEALHQTQPGMADEILKVNPTYGKMTVGDARNKYAGFGTASATPQTPATPQAAPAQPDVVPTANQMTSTQGVQNAWMQAQKLAMLGRLMPQQQQTATRNPFATSATPWAAGFGTQQQNNPLQTYQTLAMLKGLGGLGSA